MSIYYKGKKIPVKITGDITINEIQGTILDPFDNDLTVASNSAILAGYGAYDTNGHLLHGSIDTLQLNKNIIPGKDDQTLECSHKYMLDNIIIEGDSNLKAENIKDGCSIFGVNGVYVGDNIELPELDNPALSNDVAQDKEYIDENGNKQIGNLPIISLSDIKIISGEKRDSNSITFQAQINLANKSIVKSANMTYSVATLSTQAGKTITPSRSQQIAIYENYLATGPIYVKGDTNLKSENIKNGVTIFGVEGTYSESTPELSLPVPSNPATTGDVIAGKEYIIDSITGIQVGTLTEVLENNRYLGEYDKVEPDDDLYYIQGKPSKDIVLRQDAIFEIPVPAIDVQENLSEELSNQDNLIEQIISTLKNKATTPNIETVTLTVTSNYYSCDIYTPEGVFTVYDETREFSVPVGSICIMAGGGSSYGGWVEGCEWNLWANGEIGDSYYYDEINIFKVGTSNVIAGCSN